MSAAAGVVLAWLPRGLALWLCVRGAAWCVVLALTYSVDEAMRATFVSPLPQAPAMMLLTPLAGVVDLAARRELALLGNLGLSLAPLAALFAAAAGVGELALHLRAILA